MQIQVSRLAAFEASHFYRLPHLSEQENEAQFGKATFHHGHNYLLSVSLQGELDPTAGWILNTQAIDRILREKVTSQLDHICINLDHPAFQDRLPTTENLALYIWDSLQDAFPNGRLVQVCLSESDRLRSAYRGEQWTATDGQEMKTVYLTRSYEFSASHRLQNLLLSEEENRRLYGKCFSPHGHGHNYRLEITVAGEPDEQVGMVANLSELDALVEREVIQVLDYTYLNRDIPVFQQTVPTTENLVQFIWNRLTPHFRVGTPRLHRVRVYETPRSWFDITSD
jgi:6-pyruvoyltetrahydropterin/6-carboxytetrahydropterin synthase